MTNFEMVKEFHKTLGLPCPEEISSKAFEAQTLGRRNRLILEELSEYNKAISEGDTLEAADAIGDLLYVVYGTAVEHGIDIDLVFKEIHRSNMSKKDGYMDASGKWIKPDNYEKPNLSFLFKK